MAKTRTFIAIDASAEVKHGAAQLAARLRPLAEDYRWVPDENLHYTLQFLGDLTDQEVADVCRLVGRVCERLEPFTLTARGAGAFPSVQRPHTLWIGARQGGEELIDIVEALEAELQGLGFRGENRRYVPHLTIGKAGRSRGAAAELTALLEELSDYEAGRMSVGEVVVYASELLPGGPEYHVLARCPLGA